MHNNSDRDSRLSMNKNKVISPLSLVRVVVLAWLVLVIVEQAQAKPVVITNEVVSGGDFSFNVLAASNTTFTIQISSNLTSWQSVESLTSTSALTAVLDPRGISGVPQQYYRLRRGR